MRSSVVFAGEPAYVPPICLVSYGAAVDADLGFTTYPPTKSRTGPFLYASGDRGTDAVRMDVTVCRLVCVLLSLLIRVTVCYI